MPSIMKTGFVSKEQEEYLRINNPELYKQVLKKHGHYSPYPKQMLPKDSTERYKKLLDKVKNIVKERSENNEL